MSEQAAVRIAGPLLSTRRSKEFDWAPSTTPVVVGNDVLELLSTSMYVDAMALYREYTQNSADAVDEARQQGALTSDIPGRIDITIDSAARVVLIRDNGSGIAWPQFVERLSNLGSSVKRGTTARGFRGVGRLAGLGYCQELIFRSRIDGEQLVSELRWDCRALRGALRKAGDAMPINALVRDIVSVRRIPSKDHPKRFFEVELKSVVRHRNDRLLNASAVAEYLAQVAPIPFSPEFSFGPEIVSALGPHVRMGDIQIRINGATEPLYRPHRDRIEIGDGQFDRILKVDIHELMGVDGGLAGIAWILHHGYTGAIPTRALVKGIRLRTGNMQVGDNNLLEELFPEPRFNGWTIGEVHVLDPKVTPNGRRDHFEQSVHFDNLIGQLTPYAREAARNCRQSSIARKWTREFDAHKAMVLSSAKACTRGGLSKAARRIQIDKAAKSLKAMKKIAVIRHIDENIRAGLLSQTNALESRVSKLLGGPVVETNPLEGFKPQVRAAYENIISLIYEFASNSSAGASLVDKILNRLSRDASPIRGSGSLRRFKAKRMAKSKRPK